MVCITNNHVPGNTSAVPLAVLGVKFDVAVVLEDDELAVVVGEYVELDGLGVVTAFELHRQVGDVVAADARLVDPARVDVLLVRRDVDVVTHRRHLKVLQEKTIAGVARPEMIQKTPTKV